MAVKNVRINIEAFLKRAREDNMFISSVKEIVKLEYDIFNIDELEHFYSNVFKEECYNFYGWCILESEIEFIEGE